LFQNIIPWTLLSVRVLTPILLVGVYRWDSQVVLWMYLAAFVTDYAGGAVARRLGTATPTLRKADGVADTPFHFALVAYLVLRDWFEFKKNAFAVVVYLVTLIGWCVLDAIRWHRLAGFHSLPRSSRSASASG
jgi:phosphatidylglycerophosphate synthase